MQRISVLIDKYNNRTATAADLDELLILLKEQENDLYEHWKKDIEHNDISNTQESTLFDQQKNKIALLNKISAGADAQPGPGATTAKLYLRRIITAAACIGLVLTVSIFFLKKNNNGKKEGSALSANAKINTGIFSAQYSQQQILLQDSSQVLLYKGSTLEYGTLYNEQDRKLILTGRAKFMVKKDQQKPFVVYTKSNITTALGTVFEVTETGDSTMVELLEGSVKVQTVNAKNMGDIFLLPGQKALTCYRQTAIVGNSPVSPQLKELTRPGQAARQMPGNLVFKQAALEKVLRVLQEKYKVTIQFDKTELSGMLFTGTFNEKDEIAAILNIIGAINNLTITANDQGFTITK